VFRADDAHRTGSGGGVLVCIPKKFIVLSHNLFANEFFEIVDVEIYTKNVKLFRLIAVYRSPTPNKLQSVASLCDFLESREPLGMFQFFF
jgi:hypothetical protein